MGDLLPSTAPPAGVNMAKVAQAVDAAFAIPEAYTSAFVVTHKGRIIGERYMQGIGPTTPLESWSMGKSVVATMMGLLIKQGVYTLDQPAPIPEWQGEGDPRQKIRISDLLHMSSGLRIKAPDDPDFDPNGTYPDHIYFYTGRVNAFNYAATRPQQWQPNLVGRYRNTDPVLASYLVRLAVEKRGEEYLSFPQRALFDKIGIRSMVLETDPYGNFLAQGYDFMSGRDWARLANLYLQDGVWNGERILPEGFEFRAHRGARLGGRQATDLRRLLLAQRDDEQHHSVPGADLGLLHAGRGRTGGADRALARPGGGAHRALEGRAGLWPAAERCVEAADGGRSGLLSA